MSWRRLCKKLLITSVQEVMLIAERLFYWHREPFKALQEAAELKGGKKEPSEVYREESLLGQERLEGKGLTPHSPQVRAVVSQEELCEMRTGWSSLQN